MESKNVKTIAVFLFLSCMYVIHAQEERLSLISVKPDPQKCCQKRYQFKKIERKVYQEGVEYSCEGYVYQGVCGGECKVTSTTTPLGYYIWFNRKTPIPQMPGSSSHAPAVCERTLETDKVVTLTCKPTRECCEEVSYCDVKIHVHIKEPVDCACKPLEVPSIDVACHKVSNVRYHYFWLDGLSYCRTQYPTDLPYCTGCCTSEHHDYDLDFKGNTEYSKRGCQCCKSARYARKLVPVYCWSRIRSTDAFVEATEAKIETAQFMIKQIQLRNTTADAEARIKKLTAEIEFLKEGSAGIIGLKIRDFTDAKRIANEAATAFVGAKVTDENEEKAAGSTATQRFMSQAWKGTAYLTYIVSCGCIYDYCPVR